VCVCCVAYVNLEIIICIYMYACVPPLSRIHTGDRILDIHILRLTDQLVLKGFSGIILCSLKENES
jgi:hypothetical protein